VRPLSKRRLPKALGAAALHAFTTFLGSSRGIAAARNTRIITQHGAFAKHAAPHTNIRTRTRTRTRTHTRTHALIAHVTADVHVLTVRGGGGVRSGGVRSGGGIHG